VPTAVDVKEVSTLRQYMEQIEDLMAAKVPLWYRGAGESHHALVPSLFRHPTVTEPKALMALEGSILQRFRERSIPFQAIPVEKEWEFLFVMQHFGVPTRLLDWTENPYIGLFFALTSAKIDHNTGEADKPAAVWVLQPEAWNRQALSDVSYDGGVLSMGNSLLASYRPEAPSDEMRVAPVAMFGLHNSPRIVAQRGVFTIFGKDVRPMEEVFASTGFDATTLVKLQIPGHCIGALRESLAAIGVTDSVVYPDLGGLALELKRHYGYPV
jgi:hypothetical protein